MTRIIILTGFLATLKTTISHRLSKDLGVPTINKDSIKEILVDSIGFTNREENLKLSHATFQMIKYIMVKNIEFKIDTIIESNFKPIELIEIDHISKMNKVETLSIFLSGSYDVLYKRYVERQPSRHPAHTSAGLMSYETFRLSMQNYRKENCIGNVVEFDTTNFDETSYAEILNLTKSFLGK